MSFDPTDMNAADAIEAIRNLADVDALLAVRRRERGAKNRKTVLSAIKETLVEVAEEAEETAAAEAAEAAAAEEAATAARAAAAEAAATPVVVETVAPKPVVQAAPNVGTVGLVTKVFRVK